MDEVIERDGFFVFQTAHRIVYNTEKPVPIKEMIIALQGLEGLLKSVPKLVEALTGVEIERGEYHIKSLESGSLVEDIIVAFFFKDKATLEAFVAKIGGNKTVKAVVVTAALAALAGYGLHLATSSKPGPNITATNNVIINIGAGEVSLTPAAFESIVRTAVGDKKDVAVNALKFVSPARADPNSSVTFGDASDTKIVIPAAAVAESPAKIELGKNERVEEYKAVSLNIRATNLDSRKAGWAGKLGNREDRLPIELDPAVDESEVFGRSSIVVDAALVFREIGKGRELKPARIYVRRIVPAQRTGS
jgi:hypothetical protein